MEENISKIKVFAYLRKSSKQEKEGTPEKQPNSLNYQRRVIKEIEARNNLKIVRTFEDKETGYKAYVRDDFNAMCELLDEQGSGGEIKGIVCSEHNRLARNFGDGGRILWYLQNGEIEAVYTHDKIFSNTSSDQMMLAINFAMAKNSSDETSYRMRQTWRSKAIAGMPPNQRRIGYKYVGTKGSKVWMKDPKTAPLIVKVFETYATGEYSLEEIARYAASIGLVNKSNGNKPYGENTVREWLSKKEYICIFEYEGERHKGKYPRMISDDLFYRVQDVLLKRSHRRGKTKNSYAYSPKLIKCAKCGEYMTGDIQKGIVYYKCPHRKEPCKSNPKERLPHLKETVIDETIMKKLKQIEISEEKWKELSELVKANYQYEVAQHEGDVIEMRTRMGYEVGFKKQYSRAISELRVKSTLTREEEGELAGYQDLISDCNKTIELYQKAIEKAKEVMNEIPFEMEGFLESLKIASARFNQGTPANRRVIVETLCANLRWDGENVVWDLKNKYKNLISQEKDLDWLRDQDSNLEPNG
jgi:DNA invertase Pin-like site-specific DNA recombinase